MGMQYEFDFVDPGWIEGAGDVDRRSVANVSTGPGLTNGGQ
jgi:hypothetical protein